MEDSIAANGWLLKSYVDRCGAVWSAGGYEQEFRVVDARRTVWLREKVSLAPLGPGKWKLAAVVTEITQRRQGALQLPSQLAAGAEKQDFHESV